MKVSSLLALLSNFEAAVAAATGTGAPNGFKEFRQLFLGHDEQNVAALVKTLLKQRDIHGRSRNSPPIAHFRETLIKLETFLRSADGKKAADDVAKLAELLEGCGQASIGEFVNEAREWIAEAGRPKLSVKTGAAGRGRKKLAAPLIKTITPDDYVTLLNQTAKDNARFDQTIEQLRGDRMIKKAEMRDIARLFLGYELAKKKGRGDALAEIIDKQAVAARQDARASVLDRLKPW
jgi:hypothetical protein